MKVGDYIRDEEGMIAKIKKFWVYHNITFITTDKDTISKDMVVKSSPNIIDLIEENDILKYIYNQKEYVSKVINRGSLMLKVSSDLEISLGVVEIKSILTKEQFESMEYRIGE